MWLIGDVAHWGHLSPSPNRLGTRVITTIPAGRGIPTPLWISYAALHMLSMLITTTPLLVVVLLLLRLLRLVILLVVLLLLLLRPPRLLVMLLLVLLRLLRLLRLLSLVPPASPFPSFLCYISPTTTTTTTSLGAGGLGATEVQGVVVHLHLHRPLRHSFLHFVYEIRVTHNLVDFRTGDTRTGNN